MTMRNDHDADEIGGRSSEVVLVRAKKIPAKRLAREFGCLSSRDRGTAPPSGSYEPVRRVLKKRAKHWGECDIEIASEEHRVICFFHGFLKSKP